MGFLTNAYNAVHVVYMSSAISNFVKDKATDLVVKYANNLDDSKLTDYVQSHTDVSNITDEDKQQYIENADALKDFMDSADTALSDGDHSMSDFFKEAEESIANDPVAWGQYMSMHNINSELLQQFSEYAENGNLTAGDVAKGILFKNFTSLKDSVSKTASESSDETDKADKRYEQASAELGVDDMTSTDDLDFER